MSTLVASPVLVLSAGDHHEGGPQRAPEFTNAIAQSEQGLARFTNNPINFVKASDPPPTSLQPSSKYEILDDSKLLPAPIETPKEKRFIGPLLPPQSELQQTEAASADPAADTTTSSSPSSSTQPDNRKLWNTDIASTWPAVQGKTPIIGQGLENTGNTCFLNSVLQCLLHTPPLLHAVIHHISADSKICKEQSGFCMIHAFSETAWDAMYATKTRYVKPLSILKNLNKIAKGLRRGRQEDAHEFLRYSIDAFQRAALAGTDPKLPHSVKETTWVHRIFGGRLRSRVTCMSCKYNSDTFDSLLDLSIDIYKKESLRDALDGFVAIERLGGTDKYNCEKCKKPVNAEKQFTIHDAPQILTVHLKRFTPMGRKLPQLVRYSEQLSLQRYMSAGQYGPSYTLYGVICHMGSGPNSGHYSAYVKSSKGAWFDMNDEDVSRCNIPPLDRKNAYILFYTRNPGQSLESAIRAPAPQAGLGAPAEIVSAKDRAEKRKRTIPQDDDEEDLGVKATPGASTSTAHIPASPPMKKVKVNNGHITLSDPAAIKLKQKIQAATAAKAPIATSSITQSALKALAEYAGDSSEAEDADISPGPAVDDGADAQSATGAADDDERPSTPRPPAAADSATVLSRFGDGLLDLFPPSPPVPSTSATAADISSMDIDRIAPSPSIPIPIPTPTASTSTSTIKMDTIPPARFYGNKNSNNSAEKRPKHGRSNSNSDENDRGEFRRRSSQNQSYSPSRNRGRGGGGGGYRERDRGAAYRGGGGNPLTANSLRNSMHEDRTGGGGGGGGGWGGQGQGQGQPMSRKARMNGRKRSFV